MTHDAAPPRGHTLDVEKAKAQRAHSRSAHGLFAVAFAVTGVFVFVCVFVLGCDAPIGAIRRTPPEGVEVRALVASSWAPDFRLEGTRGPYSLMAAVAHDNALLVFYRGHW
jgi:hypothetical protein